MKLINLLFVFVLMMIIPFSISKTNITMNGFNTNVGKKDFSNIRLSYLDLKEELHNDIPLFKLEIPKIKLVREIYNYDSINNNVDKNVTLLYPEAFDINSTIVLAAHSGNATIAFFNNLDLLEENDTINLYFENKYYNYKVIDKTEIEKNHLLQIAKEQNVLYLTTCSKLNKNKQLVIKAEKQ